MFVNAVGARVEADVEPMNPDRAVWLVDYPWALEHIDSTEGLRWGQTWRDTMKMEGFSWDDDDFEIAFEVDG